MKRRMDEAESELQGETERGLRERSNKHELWLARLVSISIQRFLAISLRKYQRNTLKIGNSGIQFASLRVIHPGRNKECEIKILDSPGDFGELP
jgi:hypothetical protein